MKQGRICTLGPIIHNPQALADFEARGVVCIHSPTESGKGDEVLIRAHGIPRDVEEELRACCSRVQDATCPKVKKAQLAIAKATARGATLLLFGEADHPEVAGLRSYACGATHVFGTEQELEELEWSGPVVLASQTTQDRETFAKITAKLRERFPAIKVLSTICDATRERQLEALEIASKVDAMVVVGGRTSGNTRRLASLAAGAGIPALHVETVAELNPGQFAGNTTIGLTAGASTPVELIDEVARWLEGL